jgi:succinate-semialdehyde dehydrogenase/glutarate-semialdehyde dehydrogenase
LLTFRTLRRRWYDLVLAAQDDIATIMTVESGKPLAESKSEFLGGCAAYRPSAPTRTRF